MKISKKQIGDLIWVAALVILFTTPLGTTVKIYLNRLISMSPSVEEKQETILVKNLWWNLQNLEDGKRVNLKDFKGKVVFINQWATWCPPCLAEMPDIEDLYKDYKDKVVFLMVCTDDKNKVESLMSKEGYTFKNYRPLSDTPSELVESSIPHTVVLDKEGYIRVDKVGAANWNSDSFRRALDDMLME